MDPKQGGTKLRRSIAVAAVVLTLALPAIPGRGWDASSRPPLPGTASAVFHFDLQRLRQSDLYRDVEGQVGVFARSNEKLQIFLEATGLAEAAGSLSGFTLYSFSHPTSPQDFAGILSSGFGTETRQRLEQAYAPVARHIKGRVIMPVVQTPEMEVVMSFLDAGHLAFGTSGAVETVVSAPADEPGMLAAYKRTVTRRPIWGVINAKQVLQALADTAAETGDGGGPLQAFQDNPALRSVLSIGFSVDLGRDVFVEFRAFTDTAENARLLADAVKGAVALGQMGVSQSSDPDLVEFFRGVVAEAERDSVYVSFAVTNAQIEKLRGGQDLFADLIPD